MAMAALWPEAGDVDGTVVAGPDPNADVSGVVLVWPESGLVIPAVIRAHVHPVGPSSVCSPSV